MKVDFYRGEKGYLAEDANGLAWCVSGKMSDKRTNHLPGRLAQWEFLMSANFGDGDTGSSLTAQCNIDVVGEILLDIRASMAAISNGRVVVRGGVVEARLDKFLLLDEIFCFRLAEDGNLMVANVANSRMEDIHFEVPRIMTWTNLVAEAVLRASELKQAASVFHFNRPTGAYFT